MAIGDWSKRIALRDTWGNVVMEVDAFPIGVPGLLAHEQYGKDGSPTGLWTISHRTGFRFGGSFVSKRDAIDKANDALRGSTVNWAQDYDRLVLDLKAELAWIRFKRLFG